MDQFGSSIKLTSLDPNKDPIVFWFWCLKFWNEAIVEEIKRANLVLPKATAVQFQTSYNLPFRGKAMDIFDTLWEDMNGLPLTMKEIRDRVWLNPSHHYGQMHKLCLIRLDNNGNNYVVKPKKIVFDPRVKYLVGTEID